MYIQFRQSLSDDGLCLTERNYDVPRSDYQINIDGVLTSELQSLYLVTEIRDCMAKLTEHTRHAMPRSGLYNSNVFTCIV